MKGATKRLTELWRLLNGGVQRAGRLALRAASRGRTLRVAAAVVGLALAAATGWFFFPQEVPGFETVRAKWVPSDAYLLDRNGQVIDRQRVDFRVRRAEWIPLESVSPALISAIVDGEDRHFWQHSGVDWMALLGAIRDTGVAQRRRGASTISMQLASLLDSQFRAGSGSGAWLRKVAQIRMARALETHWTKREILEAYLNMLGFRGELQGVGATSRVLAGKSPSGLTLPESLVLAALLPAPQADSDRVITRACIRATARHLAARCDAIRAAATAMLSNVRPTSAKNRPTRASNRDEFSPDEFSPDEFSPDESSADESDHDGSGSRFLKAPGSASTGRQPMAARLAPHLARTLLKNPGDRVRTTLDLQIQRLALNTLHQHLSQLTSRNVRDGAILIVENDTGNVLAYVASAGPESRAREVDGIRARRQAGSTLKPFLYELALERRYLTAASLLNDAPLTLDTASGIYLPQDYDRDFKGLVSVRTALGSSLNVPAVRALMIVGVEPFRERLYALGYAGITRPGDFYGYSLALGSAEVSLWEQVQAYRALARDGRWSPIRLTPSQPETPTAMASTAGQSTLPTSAARSTQTVSLAPDATFVISDILSDRAARALTFGLDNHLNTPFWSAAKTGTSKDMRDNWCIGFSQHFTVGVWVGNFEGDSMHDVSGITGAAPVWQQVMLALHARLPSAPPAAPPGVTAARAKFSPAVEPTRRELFLNAPEPTRAAADRWQARRRSSIANPQLAVTPAATEHLIRVAGEIARIASPANGMVIAIDPDIPLQFQRVPLSARGADDRMVLKLNGTVVGPADHHVMWPPARGTYVLALEDAAGHTLDAARFIVR
jgi:penicillin-binding protein 1C